MAAKERKLIALAYKLGRQASRRAKRAYCREQVRENGLTFHHYWVHPCERYPKTAET